MTSIPIRTATDPVEELTDALTEAGCLVVTGALEQTVHERAHEELAPHLEAASSGIDQDDPEAFYPGRTRRVTALVARSATAGEIILHPISNALCEPVSYTHLTLPTNREV